MKNVLRTLVHNDQVSLVLMNLTDLVNMSIKIHQFNQRQAESFGKTMLVMTYMSSCLKEETGEISASIRSEDGDIGISGNYMMYMRGFMNQTSDEKSERDLCYNKDGTLTIIRDDGYSRPFVGACELSEKGTVEDSFEEYYKISEQIPTYISLETNFDDTGKCLFAGGTVLQPLPFADEEVHNKIKNTDKLSEVTQSIRTLGFEDTVKKYFVPDLKVYELKEAIYKCNCSREYLSEVLVSLGEEEALRMVQEDGEIRIHCHYCNKDYVFTEPDIKEIFNSTK